MEKQTALLKKQLEGIGVFASLKVLTELNILLDELLHWNSIINLTAIRAPVEAIEKHVVDSLTILPFLSGVENLLDAGSGAGFPSLPIKIYLPQITVFSIEASHKKVYFQRQITRRLDLQKFFPLAFRLEEIEQKNLALPKMDVITSRAMGKALDLARLTSNLLKKSGRLIVMKGPSGGTEAKNWQEKETGLALEIIHEITLPVSGAKRNILVFRKK